jgi:hypothetical protein
VVGYFLYQLNFLARPKHSHQKGNCYGCMVGLDLCGVYIRRDNEEERRKCVCALLEWRAHKQKKRIPSEIR